MKLSALSMIYALIAVGGLCAEAQTVVTYPADFPAKGREILETRYVHAEIVSILDGYESRIGPVYRIAGRMEGKKLELTLTYEGQVFTDLRIEDIALGEVPAPCITAAEKELAGTVFESAQKVERNGHPEFRLISAAQPAVKGVAQHYIVTLDAECTVLHYYMTAIE